MGKLNVDGTEIQVLQIEEDDYLCRLSSGFPAQIQRGLWQRQDGMEGHTHIKILRLNLQAGCLRNSNYTLSKNLSG